MSARTAHRAVDDSATAVLRQAKEAPGCSRTPEPSDALVEDVTLPPRASALLGVALLLTGIGVFIVDNARIGSSAVLLRSLPVAAVCLGVLSLFCCALRLLASVGWALVACLGLLLLTVFGPHAIMVPLTLVLLLLGILGAARSLRVSRRELFWAIAMAAAATSTIALVPGPYTSFDMIERVLAGDVRLDALYHASMAAMIKNYGVASTGLNGLVPTPYHVLSHALFAAISLLSGAPVLEVYGVATWVLFAPLLIFAASACSCMQGGQAREGSAPVWIAVCATLALVPVIFGRWALWDSYFTSESYLVSLSLFLVALPLLWKRALTRRDYLLLVVLTMAIAAAKAPVGLVLVGLFALRLLALGSGARRGGQVALLVMVSAVVLVVLRSALANRDNVEFGPLHFVESYSFLGRYLEAVRAALHVGMRPPSRTWLLAGVSLGSFLVVHFLLSWAVTLDAIRRDGLARALRLPVVMYSLGAVAAALVVVLVCRIVGGSAYYFTSVAFFVSLPAFAALAVGFFNSRGIPGRALLACIALLPFWLLVHGTLVQVVAPAPVPEARRARLVEQLLEARRTVPLSWVLQVDARTAALNPVASCRGRPLLYPALSERSWMWSGSGDVDCLYSDYGYDSYDIRPETQRPSGPAVLPPGGRVVPWSAAP